MPRCPVCKTQADLIKYEGVPIFNCGTCGGHWLTQTKLDVIVARRDVVMPEAVREKMIALADASDSKHALWCIVCGREMVKKAFRGWPDIQIDQCTKCGGLWLDRGELEKCQIYAEYLQDHPDADGGDVRARKAALDAAWVQRKAQLRESAEEAAEAGRWGVSNAGALAQIICRLFGR